MALVRGLPAESMLAQSTNGTLGEPDWDTDTELMAQMVEIMSVLASDHRIQQPITIPRPHSEAVAVAQTAVDDPQAIKAFFSRGGGG